MDIEKFFDNVNHNWLTECLRQRIIDRSFLRLIERFLKRIYDSVVRQEHKWINRRSQRKSCDLEKFERILLDNPLPKSKIYRLYPIPKRCFLEESCVGNPQARFCEGH